MVARTDRRPPAGKVTAPDAARLRPAARRHRPSAAVRSLEVERPEALRPDRQATTRSRPAIKTTKGGTIFAQAPAAGPWAPDGKALFVRGGQLVFDIGWVGAVASRTRVDDGKWHDVAMTWDHATGTVTPVRRREGRRRRGAETEGPAKGMAVRLGFASPDFPARAVLSRRRAGRGPLLRPQAGRGRPEGAAEGRPGALAGTLPTSAAGRSPTRPATGTTPSRPLRTWRSARGCPGRGRVADRGRHGSATHPGREGAGQVHRLDGGRRRRRRPSPASARRT